MVLIRFLLTVTTCLYMLLSASCADSNIADTDKSDLGADIICDDESHIYYVFNDEVLKIDKLTHTIIETGLTADKVSYYDGDLYRLDNCILYRNNDYISSVPESFPFDCFVVGSFGCWLSCSIISSYVSFDIVNLNDWEETPCVFPIIDNNHNTYFVDIRECGESFEYVIDGITIGTSQYGFTPFNDRFYIYDDNVYYVEQNVLHIVSLRDGHSYEKQNVDRILSVGHDMIYFITGDKIMKESISSGKLYECTLSISEKDICFIDSYCDIAYILDCSGETVECSIAEFDYVRNCDDGN